MTLHYFICLKPSWQLEQIRQEGVLLAERSTGPLRFYLFALHGFYAELRYSPGEGHISVIRAFEGTEGLDPYLENINISEWIPAG